MEWETTASLLVRLADERNDEAWELVCSRFRGPVARFARKLGLSSDDAEDVAQETLLSFLRAFRAGEYDPDAGRLNRWMFGIAYRRALAGLRAGSGGRAGVPAESGFLESIPDEARASAVFELEWERELLEQCERRAREEFEPETFRAYALVVHGGRAPREVAAELGVGAQSVYNAKHRVLKRIRELRERLDGAEG